MFAPSWVVFSTIAAIAAVSYAVFAELGAQTSAYVLPQKYEARLIELDRDALDAAYTQQAIHLFMQWMKDDTKQPERVTLGLKQARAAYGQAAERIEAREKAK